MDISIKKRRLNEDVRTDNNDEDSSLNESIEDEGEYFELFDVDIGESNDSHAEASISVVESQNTALGDIGDIEHSTRIIQDARALSNTLDEFTRSDLIKHLARSYLEDAIILSADKIRNISQEICVAFPDEDMASYFIEPIGRKAPGGRFFNHYQSQLKKKRQKNLIPKSSRAINKIRNAVEAEEIYVLSEQEKESVEYLLQRQTNVHEIIEHWSLTFSYRQDVFKDIAKDIRTILAEQWKPLTMSIGHALICEDFKILHGFDKAASLRLKWKTIFDTKVFLLLKETVRNRPTLRKVEQLPLTDEYLNVSSVYLLNAILVPPLQKGVKKPTIQDAQDSVVMVAKTENELQGQLNDRFVGEYATGQHPIVVVMKPNEQEIYFFVTFHNLRYRFSRFCDAIDVCFKMFCVFQIQFPMACTQYYALLNELFYNIPLTICKSTKVAELCKQINDTV